MLSDPDDESNFTHKFLLTYRQVARLCSANIKSSKTQLSRMVQLRGRLLGGLGDSNTEIETLKKDLPILGSKVTKFLVNRLVGSGMALANNEIKYIMKVIRSLETRTTEGGILGPLMRYSL